MKFCSSEWKKSNVTAKLALKQQSKNARTNSAILKEMLNLPIPARDKRKVYCVGTDWMGKMVIRISKQ